MNSRTNRSKLYQDCQSHSSARTDQCKQIGKPMDLYENWKGGNKVIIIIDKVIINLQNVREFWGNLK